MDRASYNAGLADLRPLRDEIAKLERSLAKLLRDRESRVRKLGAFDDAKAAAIAKAAGVSIGDVVALVPRLDPTPEHARAQLQQAAAAPASESAPATAAETEPEGAVAPTFPVTAAPREQAPEAPVVTTPAGQVEGAAAHATAAADHEPSPAVRRPGERIELPSIADGAAAEAYTAATPDLFSQRPNFTQGAREMVFLDATSGVMAGRGGEVRLDLGARSPGEILDAVLEVAPGAERIYVTAGAPWLSDAERYPTMKQAVVAWLDTPSQRWTVDTGRGRDRLAGHFVGNPRNPIGRYTRAGAERNAEHVEIRSVGEWFDPAGADPMLVREAFVCLWKALKVKWPDVVLMGSPSQTGKDLWARTIPLKGQWAGGYPVLSEELRALFHATAGQGRTELILPPKVTAELPGLVEYDRTFAYARHTWRSPVGTPRRVTGAAFARMTEAEQKKLLMSPAHLQVRVTVPDGWEHIGLLPAPISGDRNWEYPSTPSTPGATFTTWAGGAEVYTALSNPVQPWRIEVLDALVFAEGEPMDKWSKWLKEAWASLSAGAQIHADARQRQALYLASRAVRSILLFGIGGFAQRPRLVTGTTPLDDLHLVPEGAEILTHDERQVTWQRVSGFSRDPMAHPEWSASVWSGARAALLSMRMRPENVQVGALHVPAGQVVAFRTDAIYLTARHDWPYHGEPGDYLLKGHLTGPVPAPTSEDELLALREKGRAALAAAGGER